MAWGAPAPSMTPDPMGAVGPLGNLVLNVLPMSYAQGRMFRFSLQSFCRPSGGLRASLVAGPLMVCQKGPG